jgi:hypothetical protein
MKRKLALFLCLVMALSLVLSGCGGTAATPTTAAATAAATTAAPKDDGLSGPGVFPIVKEKATLRFFAPQNVNIKDMNTNAFTVFYEEKTNVHIVWELVPSDALADKRSLSLASSDVERQIVPYEKRQEQIAEIDTTRHNYASAVALWHRYIAHSTIGLGHQFIPNKGSACGETKDRHSAKALRRSFVLCGVHQGRMSPSL